MKNSGTAGEIKESVRLAVDGFHSQAKQVAELEWRSGDLAALQTLGVLALQEGRVGDAIDFLTRSCTGVADGANNSDTLRPSWFHNLAVAHAAAADWASMRKASRDGLRTFPQDSMLWLDAARAEYELADMPATLACYEQAASLAPVPRAGLLRWARSIEAVQGTEAAVDKLQDWLELQPDFLGGHNLLADLLTTYGHATGAAKHRRLAFALSPQDSDLACTLASELWQAGDAEGFFEITQPLVSAGSAPQALHSFYLAALLHRDDVDHVAIRDAHQRWATQFASRESSPVSFAQSLDPARRLRIGYLGVEFHHNQSFYFLVHLFRHRDPQQFEITVYDLAGVCDHASLECEMLVDRWRRMSRVTDDQLSATIRSDQIDILVDTCGHYSGGRPHLYSQRLAPVQLRIPNYPSTSGIPGFDAILTDPWVCPPGSEAQYTEPSVLRLAHGYMAYNPPANAPEPDRLPLLRNGYPTFGMFQRIQKMTPASWDAIAAVMAAVPDSRLLIHTASAGLTDPESFERETYSRECGARGIDIANRVIFVGPERFQQHLRTVARCDVALDTFPYNGQTTTCECLWMGVPVVSMHGNHHVSRIGRWVLDRAGFPEWCVNSQREFATTAASLVSDPAHLAHLRASMRERVRTSQLTSGDVIARDTEACYRQLWKAYCEQRRF